MNCPSPSTRWWLAALLLTLPAQAAERQPPRAQPPTDFPADVREVFFADPAAQLVGPRPSFAPQVAAAATTTAAAPDTQPTATTGETRWSDYVSAEVLEAELKRQVQRLGPLVATPTAFKGGGYRDCRDSLGVVAMLLTVTAKYDSPARWQDVAADAAAIVGRAAANCKVGTDGSFREAQLRQQDLADLVQGNRPDFPKAEPDIDWALVADRTPLMRRMEQALGENIGPQAGDARALANNAEALVHEAQLLAMLAEATVQPGQPDADDETYAGFARALRDASVEFGQAAEGGDYDRARAALGNMGKACSDCHDSYRG